MTPTDRAPEEPGFTTPSTSTHRDAIAESLRAWARGVLPTEAAVELLINALGGRLLNGSWVRPGTEAYVRYWFDTELAATESDYLSGGERRVLAIAASLAGGDPVDLSDAITGIDHEALRLVLAALEHAGGGPGPSVAAPFSASATFASQAYEVDGGHWVIRFPIHDEAWELEIPGSAIADLPVRLHLGEVGSGRGVQASAKVSWRTYFRTLARLNRRPSSPQVADDCLRTLLHEGFSDLSAALRAGTDRA